MSIVFNTKTYTLDNNISANVVGYRGAAKTAAVKDDLSFKRVMAKPTTVFSGVGRSTAKLTRTLTLTNALTPTGEAIIEISSSVPVGAATADVEAMIDDCAA